MRRRLLALAAVVACVMLAGMGCADRLILYPSTMPLPAPGAERRAVPWEDGELEIWVARSPGAERAEPRVLTVEFCGNAMRAEHGAAWLAERWGELPVECWIVNYPGYGGSTGPATLARVARASLAAYDAVVERAAGRPIVASGISLGTSAALHVAAEREVAGVVLQNPPPLRRMILQRFGWWNLWLVAGPIALRVPRALDALDSAPRVGAPAVFLLARNDEVVPPKYQRMVVEAFAGPIVAEVGYDGGHNDAPDAAAEAELERALAALWRRHLAAD